LFGGKVEYVTPVAHHKDLPQLKWRRLILLHHHYQGQETAANSPFVWLVRFKTHTLTINCLVVVKQNISLQHFEYAYQQEVWEKTHGAIL
jgi:hypothetical protein